MSVPIAAVIGRRRLVSSQSLGILGFGFFSALLLSPSVTPFFLPAASAVEAQSALILSIVYWVAWVSLWGRPFWACLVSTPLLLITPITHYLLLRYHAQLSPQLMGVILETNLAESTEFLSDLCQPILAVYSVLAVVALLTLRWMYRYDVRWTPRWRLIVLIGLSEVAVLWHFIDRSPAAQPSEVPSDLFSTHPWPDFLERARLTSPFGVILQIVDGFQAEQKIRAANRLKESFKFGATQTGHSDELQVYVLIVGESSRRDSWSLYGYTRQTSPRLERERNLIVFSDAVTVAPWTRASVPVILTRKSAQRALDLQFSERSLISVFREAGFATYWLSVQLPNGAHDSPYAGYAQEAEHVTYFNLTGSWAGETPLDGVMLEPLRQVLAKTSERRQLIVLHTLGSHLDYQYRYPPEFEVFKPSLGKAGVRVFLNDKYVSALTNTYDNSVLYTDYFVSEVIAAVEASGRRLATVTFVSDHGDNLFEGDCHLLGHPHMTVENLRIPLLFWYSTGFQKAFPHQIATLKSHQAARLTTEAVFPLVVGAAGIHFPGEDSARSVISDAFTPLSSRLVRAPDGRTTDFDHAHIGKGCELVN